jgi:hypothetical protein
MQDCHDLDRPRLILKSPDSINRVEEALSSAVRRRDVVSGVSPGSCRKQELLII